jgi:KilA domain-containing protein
MSRKAELVVKNINVSFFSQKEEDYISLTDIAKYKNSDDPRFVIQNWMKTRSTVEFLGIWEVINNPCFNSNSNYEFSSAS